MKKRVFAPLLALCIALSLLVPALAFQDYGLLYDATGKLDAEQAQTANDYLLKDFDDKYGIELRVDVVNDLEGYKLSDYADLFYNKYEYGDKETGHGVLLTIQVHEDETGLALDGYNLMAGEKTKKIMSDDAWDTMDEYLRIYLNKKSWQKEMKEDDDAFFCAVSSYYAGMEYCVAQKIITPPKNTVADPDQTGQTGDQKPEGATSAAASAPSSTPDTSAQGTVQDSAGPYVRDEAGILDEESVKKLEAQAETISAEHQCAVYILTVKDFTVDGADTIRDFAKSYYTDNNLGWGDGKDGELLVLSMSQRKASQIAYGSKATSIFVGDNQARLEEGFKDNFKVDDWAGGFADFLTMSEEMLVKGANGGDYDPDYEAGPNWKALGIAVLASCVIALIVCFIFKAQMKSARLKTDAADYVTKHEITFTTKEDRFTHSTETRVRIHDDDDSGGGGGVDSDGFTGRDCDF